VTSSSAPPEQLRQEIAGMARFMRLRSLQLGGVPMYRQASGIASTMEDLPEIAEIVRVGWQPVPAMKADRRLWLSRYGDGNAGEVRLVACNPESEEIATDVEVFGEYIGNGGWLLADETGQPLSQRVIGQRTEAEVTVPPAWQTILRPVAMVSADAQFSATVSFEGDIHERVLRIAIAEVAAPFEIAPLDTQDWRAQLRREPIRVSEPGVVEVRQFSNAFASPAEEILSFPFIEEGEPACSIVIPEDPTDEEEYAAFRVQEYFRFIGSQPDRDGKPTVEGPMIPIVRGEADGRRVVLTTPPLDQVRANEPPPSSIRIEGGDLLVEYSPFAASPSAAVYRLLGLLDREHPFHGATPVKFEDEREMGIYERAGLIDAVLHDREELGM